MGQSMETRVKFVAFDGRYDIRYIRDIDTPYPTEDTSEITHKAKKALEGVEPGDIIEVVWDYDTAQYDIVQAKRVTGSAEEGVRLLTERVEKLESLIRAVPNLIRAATDRVVGDRYEEARRVQHSVAMGLEILFEKELDRG